MTLFPTINASTTAHSFKAEGGKGKNISGQTVHQGLALQCSAATVSLSKAQPTGHSLRKMRESSEGKKILLKENQCKWRALLYLFFLTQESKIHTAQLKTKQKPKKPTRKKTQAPEQLPPFHKILPD